MKIFYNCLLLIMSLLVFSCQNNNEEGIDTTTERDIEVNSLLQKEREATTINVNHRYNYYGKEFEVTYVFDNETKKIIDAYGDVAIAKEIFSKEKSPEGSLVVSKEENKRFVAINFMIFDTADEIDTYLEKSSGKIKENVPSSLNRNNCFNTSLYGETDVHFYEDTGYNREFHNIKGIDRRVHGIQYLSAENDKISSFYMNSPKRAQLHFYEHSCYTGKRLTFDKGFNSFYGVNDLSLYTLSGWWFWRKSWNDQASSLWLIQRS